MILTPLKQSELRILTNGTDANDANCKCASCLGGESVWAAASKEAWREARGPSLQEDSPSSWTSLVLWKLCTLLALGHFLIAKALPTALLSVLPTVLPMGTKGDLCSNSR